MVEFVIHDLANHYLLIAQVLALYYLNIRLLRTLRYSITIVAFSEKFKCMPIDLIIVHHEKKLYVD